MTSSAASTSCACSAVNAFLIGIMRLAHSAAPSNEEIEPSSASNSSRCRPEASGLRVTTGCGGCDLPFLSRGAGGNGGGGGCWLGVPAGGGESSGRKRGCPVNPPNHDLQPGATKTSCARAHAPH